MTKILSVKQLWAFEKSGARPEGYTQRVIDAAFSHKGDEIVLNDESYNRLSSTLSRSLAGSGQSVKNRRPGRGVTPKPRDPKTWTLKDKSRGLGDTIAKAAHATGLDKVAKLAERVTGRPCGCGWRQSKLNKRIKYGTVD